MRLSPLQSLFLILPLALSACREAKVAVYQIPKEEAHVHTDAAVATPHPGMPDSGNMAGTTVATAGPSLTWTAPDHWRTTTGSSVRKGSYAVGDEGGPVADLAITAFPGNVGGDLANVNRWRAQMQLPAVPEADLANLLEPMEVNGLKMMIVDIAGGSPADPQRMLGAIVPFDRETWFFKLVGPDAVVKAEKAAYLSLLHSVRVNPGAASPTPEGAVGSPEPMSPITPPASDMANSTVRTAGGPDLKWSAPDQWQSQPAAGMRKATYQVTGEDGAAAELAVTAFPGDVGGELANVNRWRGQMQLPPLTDAELPAAITRLTSDGLQIAVVDFNSANQRLLGAIVPVGDVTWFFKFTGPPTLIEREKPAFFAFLQTLQQP